jgi:plasmid stability protein
MATLTIRNLPQELHDGLRRRAAMHRRSMEAEAREVLRSALQPTFDVTRQAAAVAQLQEMGRAYTSAAPAGWSFVDQHLAERRLEAAWEDGRVTNEERLDWLDRLERFSALPAELESFVASRTDS